MEFDLIMKGNCSMQYNCKLRQNEINLKNKSKITQVYFCYIISIKILNIIIRLMVHWRRF